jgi:nitroreductase
MLNIGRHKEMNETLTTIKKRRSFRGFLPEQLQDAHVQAILEAGTYAPSAANQQSWHFTVIQDKQLMEQMSQDLRIHLKKAGDPRFARIADMEGFSAFHHAPTAIIVSGDSKALLPQADCAAATQNLLLAAESLDVGSCWVNLPIHLFASDNAEKWREKLSIPEGYKPLYGAVFGYKGAQSPPAAPRKESVITFVKG